VRQLAVPEHEGRGVDGGEPRCVQGRGAGVREDRQRQDRERVEAGRRQRHPAHHPRAAEPHREPGDRAEEQLVDHDAEEAEHPVVEGGSRADEGDQQHGRGVVEAGLGLEGTGQRPGQGHPAEHREHRGGVGGRGDGAQQDGELPVEPEQVVRADRHHRHADRDTERGQRDTQSDRRPDLVPLRGQTTFGQDHHQGGEAEGVRHVGVLELDAQAGLAEQHAHQQVDQQAGKSGPHRDPHGQDRHEHDDSAQQQNRVQLMRVEAHGHLGVSGAARPHPSGRSRAPWGGAEGRAGARVCYSAGRLPGRPT